VTTSNGRPLAGAAATKQNFDTRIVPQARADSRSPEVTVQQQVGLEAAGTLISLGVPLFVAQPALNGGLWDPRGGTGGCGYMLPSGWQNSTCDLAVLYSEAGGWRPGWALCAVMGHTLDLLDIDPRNGGDASRDALVAEGVWPAVLAKAATPSGGTHEFIKALGVGSRDAVRAGFDVKGGRPDGTGRGLAFLAPTEKLSKTTGRIEPYLWIDEPKSQPVSTEDTSGQALARIVRESRKAPAKQSAPLTSARPVTAQKEIPAGQRHTELFKLACSLRGSGVSREEADTCVRALWTQCDQPTGNPYPLEDALEVLRDVYERYEGPPGAGASTGRPGGAAALWAPSWAPQDLSSVLNGTYERAVPTLLERSDGQGLLYPGLTHSLHGESESGKSLLMQIECARLVEADQDVLYLDFESDPASVVERLCTFGASPATIAEHFYYVRPGANPLLVASEGAAWRQLLARSYALVVIDGVTDALTMFGHATKDNDGITAFSRDVPRRLADQTGAAVVMVDHVTKDNDSRGRFAIGGQAKMNALTGAAYTVDVAEPLGQGLRGVIVLRVAKDRPGSVRESCGAFRKLDRTQEAARGIIDSRDPESSTVTIQGPRVGGEGPRAFRPTGLMEKASMLIEEQPGLSKNDLLARMGCKRNHGMQASDTLVREGYVTRTTGSNKSQLHTSARKYRQVADPQSDAYDE